MRPLSTWSIRGHTGWRIRAYADTGLSTTIVPTKRKNSKRKRNFTSNTNYEHTYPFFCSRIRGCPPLYRLRASPCPTPTPSILFCSYTCRHTISNGAMTRVILHSECMSKRGFLTFFHKKKRGQHNQDDNLFQIQSNSEAPGRVLQFYRERWWVVPAEDRLQPPTLENVRGPNRGIGDQPIYHYWEVILQGDKNKIVSKDMKMCSRVLGEYLVSQLSASGRIGHAIDARNTCERPGYACQPQSRNDTT